VFSGDFILSLSLLLLLLSLSSFELQMGFYSLAVELQKDTIRNTHITQNNTPVSKYSTHNYIKNKGRITHSEYKAKKKVKLSL
jgi:hypothetical protein